MSAIPGILEFSRIPGIGQGRQKPKMCGLDPVIESQTKDDPNESGHTLDPALNF